MSKGPYTVEEPFPGVWDISRGNEFVLTIHNFSKSKAKQVCELLNEADYRAREEERAAIGQEWKEPGNEETAAAMQERKLKISCAPGCEAWKIMVSGPDLVYNARSPGNLRRPLHEIASDPLWTGRYGYVDKVVGRVVWLTTPRAWSHTRSGHTAVTEPVPMIGDYTPILPHYVEMRK